MNPELAIIIPAFKPDFLERALKSIDQQSDKRFQVYIGNDGSPYDLLSICEYYLLKNGWKYHAFENNLGKNNLVGHWNRCIRLSKERWVWLFSDDDEMQSDCVEKFYLAVNQFPLSRVFKFDFSIINENSEVTETNSDSIDSISAFDFGKKRFERKLFSSAVEFIFSRKSFEREGGFIEFPAAWCSDDASWIAFSGDAPIQKINGGLVYWRLSNVNISGDSIRYRTEKISAAISFITWFNKKFPQTRKSTLYGEQIIWLRLQLVQNKTKLSLSEAFRILKLLRPKGLGNWLRTFNELYLRNGIIVDQQSNTPVSALRMKLSRTFWKF
jgi:glycosyltransferase involved in cell wall biosynthesis